MTAPLPVALLLHIACGSQPLRSPLALLGLATLHRHARILCISCNRPRPFPGRPARCPGSGPRCASCHGRHLPKLLRCPILPCVQSGPSERCGDGLRRSPLRIRRRVPQTSRGARAPCVPDATQHVAGAARHTEVAPTSAHRRGRDAQRGGPGPPGPHPRRHEALQCGQGARNAAVERSIAEREEQQQLELLGAPDSGLCEPPPLISTLPQPRGCTDRSLLRAPLSSSERAQRRAASSVFL